MVSFDLGDGEVVRTGWIYLAFDRSRHLLEDDDRTPTGDRLRIHKRVHVRLRCGA